MRLMRATWACVLLCWGCQHAEHDEPELAVKVRCVSPELRAIDESLELRGHLEPPPGGDLPLASQVAGRIVELLVHEGQRVNAGDVVATVDDLASRDAVRQAEAALAQANAAALNASATLERTRVLVNRGIAARQELDDATAKAETEKQAVASTQAALDLARRTLGRVRVRAAFGGLVTRVWRGPGALVDGSAAMPIAEVAAASGVEFDADATQSDLARVEAGQSASVQLGAALPKLAGVVRALSGSLDSATGLGVVRVTLNETPAGVPMGAQGRVVITTRHRDALLLPIAVLRAAVADGAEVVLCTPEGAKLRAVSVGYRDAQRFEVQSGLLPNDKIAIDHVLGLRDGTALVQAP